MRKYTEMELKNLQESHMIENGTYKIDVRESGKRKGTGYAEPYEIEATDQNKLFKLIGEYSNDEMEQAGVLDHAPVAMVRNMFGFPSMNLNTQEIYSAYEELAVEDDSIGIWRYFKRRTVQKERPCLVFIHGGGWIAGSAFATENQCRLIAQIGDAVVFNLDYTLAPEAKFPMALTSCLEAIRHIREHAKEYGIDVNRMMIAGDSAGGNLAAALTLMIRQQKETWFQRQYLLYPGIAMGQAIKQVKDYQWSLEAYEIAEEEREWMVPRLSLGDSESPLDQLIVNSYLENPEDIYQPLVSPMLEKDLTGLPAATIVTAEYDGLRIQGELYAKHLQDAGVQVKTIRYAGTFHAFFDRLGYSPQAEAVCIDIAQELKALKSQ